jgi:sulfotransferase family protein
LAGKPNFFIVGAPKCGTTALYDYLREHPNVFMSELKEPHYFSTDLITHPLIKTPEDYIRLFSDSTQEHLRIGEASASYLLSAEAARNIRAFSRDAKIIAMFRNPVDMVHSFHSQLLYWSDETVEDFETAWGLQERRSRGLDVPRSCREPFWLQYAQLGRFGSQTQRLLAAFPREQVKLILYDDFAASPQTVYNEVIDFLEIPHDHRTDFPRVNENKRAKSAWFRDFYRAPPPVLHKAFVALKQLVGAEQMIALKQRIVDLNTVKERRRPLSLELRGQLVETFREEVALLSRLLNRDLGHWK